MAGSGSDYAWRAGLWSLFVVLTLGLALPWRQAALERFKMRHTFYGDLPGASRARARSFQARLVAVASGGCRIARSIAWPFIYAAFKAVEWRWWVSGIRFGDVHFESDMRRGALIGLYWKVIGWSVLLVVALSSWIGGRDRDWSRHEQCRRTTDAKGRVRGANSILS